MSEQTVVSNIRTFKQLAGQYDLGAESFLKTHFLTAETPAGKSEQLTRTAARIATSCDGMFNHVADTLEKSIARINIPGVRHVLRRVEKEIAATPMP